jgi:hypothetical protein
LSVEAAGDAFVSAREQPATAATRETTAADAARTRAGRKFVILTEMTFRCGRPVGRGLA